jgi:hypothetical protein
MNFIQQNWFWKNFQGNAEIISTDFPNFLTQKLILAEIPFSGNHSIIWPQLVHFEYDYDNIEIIKRISNNLPYSPIINANIFSRTLLFWGGT